MQLGIHDARIGTPRNANQYLVARARSTSTSRFELVPDLCLVAQLLPELLQTGSRPTTHRRNSCPSCSKLVPDLQITGPTLARVSPNRFPTYASSAQLLPESLQISSRTADRRPSSCSSRSKSVPDLRLVGPALARAAPD
ncbi:hypothetical protein C4D60_Mb06t15970 [Musa balbisiana]|uniref:Uncharacterized protein n=1 Tax=Musa balbisiana TaxID=52838 RepID=A0A4S8INC7_MUSBA|nr:hypothetical protein C4D60_Mb06t15970 [Musa balbisiana]